MRRFGNPVFLERVELHPENSEDDLFSGEIRADIEGEITAVLECDARSFPLERLCRFVRHVPETPYTFSNMEFAEMPPGIRVGPWPGWRGIPSFRGPTLTIGRTPVPLQASFWGDEFATGVVRFIGRALCEHDTAVTSRRSDQPLVPLNALLYRTSSVRAVPRALSLPHRPPDSHPFLLLNSDTVAKLRAASTTTHKDLWQEILALLGNWQKPFEKSPESKAVPGPERLSSEDRVMISAFVALLEPNVVNERRALLAYHEYRRETRRPDFEPLQIDTQSGEVLFTLSLAYDWLWPLLPEDEKDDARNRLREVADICWGHLGYERRDYAQAHYLGCGLGLLAFSLLFWNDHPLAREWGEHLRGSLDCILELLPMDGSYPHGINLWIYETGFLLRWIELIRSCTGEDLWDTPALRRLSDFRAATLSPDGLYGVTMGDPQYRVGGDSWHHFLVAARTGSPLAQLLALRLQNLPHEGIDFRNVPPRRRVYEFLFSDPTLPAAEELPQVSWFGDTGQLCRRTDSTLFTFRSGHPLGRQRYEHGEYGAYGHSDPANGSFLLYHNNAFTVSGPGPVYRRDTSLHNVITIDGQGQVGDSTVWMPDFIPPDRLAERPEQRTDGRRILLVAHLATSYLPHLGVESLSRSLAIDLDRYILGVDTIDCMAPHSLEWNIHAWGPVRHSGTNDTYLFPGDVRLFILAPASPAVSTGLSEFIPAYPNDGTRDTSLVFSDHAQSTRFIWCFLMTGEPAPQLEPGESRSCTIRFSDRHTVNFDGTWLTPGDFHDSAS